VCIGFDVAESIYVWRPSLLEIPPPPIKRSTGPRDRSQTIMTRAHTEEQRKQKARLRGERDIAIKGYTHPSKPSMDKLLLSTSTPVGRVRQVKRGQGFPEIRVGCQSS